MKKLLALMLSLCIISLLLFVACDSSKKKDDDDDEEKETVQTNAPTTSKGYEITKEEWIGMLGASNYTATFDGGSTTGDITFSVANGNSLTLWSANPDMQYFYAIKNKKAYRVIVDGKTATATEIEKSDLSMGITCFEGILDADDYDNLVYNETMQSYTLSKQDSVFIFNFEDGVIQSATVNSTTYTFSAYGTTTVKVPSFKVPTGGNSDSENEGVTNNTSGNTVNTGNGGNTDNTGNGGNTDNTGNGGNTDNTGSNGGNTDNTGNGGNTDNTGSNGGNTDNTGNSGNTDNTGSNGGNTDNTGNSGNTDNTGNGGIEDVIITTINRADWEAACDLDNVEVTMNGTLIYRFANGACESIGDIEAGQIAYWIIHNNESYLIAFNPASGEYEAQKTTDADLRYSEISFRAMFLPGLMEYNLYDSLEYNADTACYSLYDTVYYYFENGSLSKVVMSAFITLEYTFANHGNVDFTVPSVTLPGDEIGGGEDDTIRNTITYEEWVDTINLKNFVFSDGDTGIVYIVTEYAYKRECLYDLTEVVIQQDGYVYWYQMDENGIYNLIDSYEITDYLAPTLPTLGELIGYVDEETFYDLYYDEDDACYLHDGYRFIFENGKLVEFDYAADISGHGTTVIEDLPSVGDGGSKDETTRTEITYEEWCNLFAITNFTARFSDSYCYYNENVVVTYDAYSDIHTYFIHRDGIEFVISVDSYGNATLESMQSVPDYTSETIGSFVFGNDARTEEYFNSLSYYAPTGRYSKDSAYLYFENGYLVNYDNFIFFSDFGTTVIENMPNVDDYIYSDDDELIDMLDGGLTNEQWNNMLTLNNYRVVLSESNEVVFVDFEEAYFYSPSETYYIVSYDESSSYYVYYEHGIYYGMPIPKTDLSVVGLFLIDSSSFYDLVYDNSMNCYILCLSGYDDYGAYYDDEYHFYFADGVISKVINYFDGNSYTYNFYDIGETAVDVPEFALYL